MGGGEAPQVGEGTSLNPSYWARIIQMLLGYLYISASFLIVFSVICLFSFLFYISCGSRLIISNVYTSRVYSNFLFFIENNMHFLLDVCMLNIFIRCGNNGAKILLFSIKLRYDNISLVASGQRSSIGRQNSEMEASQVFL